MKIEDIRCDGLCGLCKGAASNWFQITTANGTWQIGPLTEAASSNGGAAPLHVCPKPECAGALLRAWQEKQGENTLGKVRLVSTLEEEADQV
jgi:hypothetical protein